MQDPPDQEAADSLAYYEANAEQFDRETLAVVMAPLHARFLAHLPPGADILDAGCGTGRDALAFARLGHRVTAFDTSPTLATIASDHLGQVVPVMRFDDVAWREAFDGIWACASLLHVPLVRLSGVFDRLAVALRPGGILYCSFKHGRGERESGGRHFTDMDVAACGGRLLRRARQSTRGHDAAWREFRIVSPKPVREFYFWGALIALATTTMRATA